MCNDISISIILLTLNYKVTIQYLYIAISKTLGVRGDWTQISQVKVGVAVEAMPKLILKLILLTLICLE